MGAQSEQQTNSKALLHMTFKITTLDTIKGKSVLNVSRYVLVLLVKDIYPLVIMSCTPRLEKASTLGLWFTDTDHVGTYIFFWWLYRNFFQCIISTIFFNLRWFSTYYHGTITRAISISITLPAFRFNVVFEQKSSTWNVWNLSHTYLRDVASFASHDEALVFPRK